MRVSWNWLGDFVDLEGLTPDEVADRLTMSGMEVEGVDVVGGELDAVVVGHVLECRPHPDADSLSLCKVDSGEGEPLQIVCGAPNVAAGARVPLARVGTTLPGDFKIKKAKIRGVASFGMLCSAVELGLGQDASGLMLLDGKPAAGTPITELLGTRDTVLDISLTPNRPDGLSIRGVAREVGALFGREVREVAAAPPRATTGDVSNLVRVDIEDPEGCPRYACVAVRGVRVGPSPEWMVRRLEAVGQRSVNNLVDVTNYVLFEQGQPLHAFDLTRVRDGHIVVRRARDGETIEAIDHVDRALQPSDLLICDGVGPVAIAGVMGGAESEVSVDTTDVLIECANFQPTGVRRTARKFGMHTESSHRFERGVDIDRIPAVLQRTLDLIAATQAELDNAYEEVGGVVDVYPTPYVAPTIRMQAAYVGRILGMDISAAQTVDTLRSVGLDVVLDGDDVVATVPAFRPDLERPIDLVEEVGRVLGYDALPSTPLPGELGLVHKRRSDAPPRIQDEQTVRTTAEIQAYDALRDALVDAGLFESVNWSMVDPSRAALFSGDDDGLRLLNPLGEERSVMRRTLFNGLLDGIRHNLAHGAESVGLFEIGRVYPPGEVMDQNPEPTHLAAVVAGSVDVHWSAPTRPVDGHDVVGLLVAALRAAGVTVETVSADAPRWAHPGASAAVKVGRRTVGWVGRIHPDVLDRWDIETPVFGWELEVGELLSAEAEVPQYQAIARTPSSGRDAALVVSASTPYSELRKALAGFNHKLLESVELFDVFVGGSLPEGQKSLAIRALYRDPAGTLTDDAVDKVHSKLLRHMERQVGAVLRS